MSANRDERLGFLKIESRRDAKSLNKVYFTCHKDDYDKYYERVCNDVFEHSDNNCIIYSKVNSADMVPEGELDFLDDINLVVVPVTLELLTDKEKNYALDEIEYAKRKNIIILPVMMEPGLDDLYATVFGKRQWVSPEFTGNDAVSYTDKLKKFFDSHFTSDETVGKIKDSFSSRIFLSYRKKDRKHAKPLMKEIHDREELRDVAIWYDEYLPLAEDFEKSIEQEMEASRAVAFLVTDNLTEEGNYVKRIEYPRAKDKDKTIFPLLPIGADIHCDKENVRAAFDKERPGFPDFAEIGDVVEKLERDDKEDTAEHKYLIGLAYLNGVDVEKDAKRAVKLIEESANQGYIPANVELLDMYLIGDSVEQDYDMACKWGEKAYELYCKSEEFGENHEKTLGILNDLGVIYSRTGEYPLAKEYLAPHLTCDGSTQLLCQ